MYRIGSVLLGLKNTRDNDYIEIVDEVISKHGKEDDKEIHFMTLDEIKDNCEFKISFEHNTRLFINLVAYQYDADIIGQDFPYEYHMLDYKAKWIELLKFCCDNNLFGTIKLSSSDYCRKHLYHLVYIYYVLLNNSVELTDEQLETIQKIHDGEMLAVEFIPEFRAAVYNL